MENDALFHEYSRKHEAQVTSKTKLPQISNTSKQKITNNNSNSTNNSDQRLIADQLAVSKNIIFPSFEHAGIYSLPDRPLRHMESSGEIRISAPMRDRTLIPAYSRTIILSPYLSQSLQNGSPGQRVLA
ncbi:hypothetical protein AVEN_178947-1 [Araneus ventricosus]|uniref:Uncharacterized protein n=1 Tax=Araneus ventricosus TaxID=182803 RepID=A0A4Y2CJK3_ARAVE|nr:hypothetical protein AVEN_174172-1 [Araneus ventricosus]GBM04558.1 hypothetical protein AVEN_178947-1 [Araneus ventricosus]